MKNKQLKDFIKIYNQIPKKDCRQFIEELKEVDWEEHNFYTARDGGHIKHNNEPSVYYEAIPSNEVMMKHFWGAIEQYILKDFKSSYFHGWQGYTTPKYIKYVEGNEMVLHCDHIHEMFDGTRKGIPILSVIAGLNDDYEGGELVINEDVIRLNQGQVIVFPSNFLYPHKVNNVTRGTRYSSITWVW
jgi:predicted 2-oxoglutarate/Fe(II)-dependent dioxygenase YbiX